MTQEMSIPGQHQVFMVGEADQQVLPLLTLDIMLRLGTNRITIFSMSVVISRQSKEKDEGAAIRRNLIVINRI
jgi:hypothetical protein